MMGGTTAGLLPQVPGIDDLCLAERIIDLSANAISSQRERRPVLHNWGLSNSLIMGRVRFVELDQNLEVRQIRELNGQPQRKTDDDGYEEERADSQLQSPDLSHVMFLGGRVRQTRPQKRVTLACGMIAPRCGGRVSSPHDLFHGPASSHAFLSARTIVEIFRFGRPHSAKNGCVKNEEQTPQ